MSTQNVSILTPHGRRPVVKVLPNMTILQILEEVCKKFDLPPQNYDLKHHKRILDVQAMFRFSGLPNNAQLEMVEAVKTRSEAEVILGIQLEDGNRVQGSFKPPDSLLYVLKSLCPDKSELETNPVIIYMRKEVYGESLQTTTLKSLGLTGGRAILRLVHKKPEELKIQKHVSAPLPSKSEEHKNTNLLSSNLLKSLKQEKDVREMNLEAGNDHIEEMDVDLKEGHTLRDKSTSPEIEVKKPKIDTIESESEIEEPIIIELGERNAVVFSLESSQIQSITELPDSFFDLTVNDVKKLLRDLKKTTTGMDDAPLLTSKMRELEESNKVLNYLGHYKTTVIRIQFPDRLVLQGTFSPVETIGNVMEFVRNYLRDSAQVFFLYTTPPKLILDKDSHLVEVKCVPQALLHFGTDLSLSTNNFLKDELSLKLSSASAATRAASKSRGLILTSNKEEDNKTADPEPGTSSAHINLGAIPKQKTENFHKSTSIKEGSTPKWFKPTGK